MPFLSFLLLFLSAACFQRSRAEQQYTVYLNSSNGTTDNVSCWEGDQEVPCRSLENVWIKIFELTAHAEVVSTPSNVADGTIQEQWSNTNESIGEVCPTWMHHSNETGRCKCGITYHEAIKCNSTLNETYILDCYRMTYDETQGVIAGRSFYGCLNQANQNDIYHLVPANRSQINEVMCSQFYRDGRLCGACKRSYSPLVYSYQLHCKKCTDTESKYNWAKFVAMAFVPLTGFYIFVLVFKFNANSPRMQGYVFFAQVMACPANIRIMSSGWRFGKIVTYLTKFHSTLYGIWNLDYFRTLYPDTCLQLTTLQALSLDYIIAIYPLVLILITYILIKLHSRGCRVLEWIWKLIKKCLVKFKHVDNIRASMIDVFATFLLLMYCKILSVNFDLLAYTIPIDSNGKSVGRYLYYDASYEHFGKEHLPYGIMAIVAFTVVNFLPFPFIAALSNEMLSKTAELLQTESPRLAHVCRLVCRLLQGRNGEGDERLSLLCSTVFPYKDYQLHCVSGYARRVLLWMERSNHHYVHDSSRSGPAVQADLQEVQHRDSRNFRNYDPGNHHHHERQHCIRQSTQQSELLCVHCGFSRNTATFLCHCNGLSVG